MLFASALGLMFATAAGAAAAQIPTSTNYSVDEAFFGSGGQLCDPGLTGISASYCASSTAGDLGVGAMGSTSYGAVAGSNTSRQEYLEFTVNASNTSLGNLSISSPAMTTGTFSVKAYTASGYTIINASDPPTNSNSTPYALTNLTSPTAYNSTAEQFGINLVDNAAPVDIGANVTHTPSVGSFGFGAAASGYNTADVYKYVKGDTIASSAQSSGTSNFTVSYLVKINGQTPAGKYTFNHVMVALGTY